MHTTGHSFHFNKHNLLLCAIREQKRLTFHTIPFHSYMVEVRGGVPHQKPLYFNELGNIMNS